MELILRSFFIYAFILVIFRIAGKRTLSQLTTFDFILLLMVGQATQQALLMNDYSVTGAILVILTLVLVDVFIAFLSKKSKFADKLVNGVPVIVIENGVVMKESLRSANVGVDDVLEAARKSQGLESIDKIKYAILEKDGQISIIPKGKG